MEHKIDKSDLKSIKEDVIEDLRAKLSQCNQ